MGTPDDILLRSTSRLLELQTSKHCFTAQQLNGVTKSSADIHARQIVTDRHQHPVHINTMIRTSENNQRYSL